jgi:hypothetical protein
MKRHIREKAIIDHVAEALHEPADDEPTVHSPTTSAGLPVEEQVRKEWDPSKGGLSIL